MSESYHAVQQPLFSISIEHVTPDCVCTGKHCTACKETKCVLAFSRQRKAKDGIRPNCKVCASEKFKRYRSANPEVFRRGQEKYLLAHPDAARLSREKYRKQNYAYNLKQRLHTYGLKLTDFNRMLESQNGVCAICHRPAPQHKIHKRLSIDHDHATGNVRGLLCHHCNTLLGAAGDNIDTLKSAIDYLEASKKGGE